MEFFEGEADMSTIMGMTFNEMSDPFYTTDAVVEALRSEKISIGEHENLYSLLKS